MIFFRTHSLVRVYLIMITDKDFLNCSKKFIFFWKNEMEQEYFGINPIRTTESNVFFKYLIKIMQFHYKKDVISMSEKKLICKHIICILLIEKTLKIRNIKPQERKI